MAQLCINSRDEMLIIDLEQVAYVQANGNYSKLMYVSGQHLLISLGLTKIEELIRKSVGVSTQSRYVRLGRSLIINQRYLYRISVARQKLMLSDYVSKIHELDLPKPILKQYKEQLSKSITSK